MSVQEDKAAVRLLTRAREDFQAMRKRMDNRIGRKADGTLQNIDKRYIREQDLGDFMAISDVARKQEKIVEKKLKEVLERFAIYNEWLVNVKGIGTVSSGHIVGEYDIEKATTVSKMWQFTGLNPGMVRGKKRVKKDEYKKSMGAIVGEMHTHYFVLTDSMVRGDKLSPGFISPFNKGLRTALLGVMADGFIKAQNSYALEYYYTQHIPEKYRKDEKAMEKKPALAGQYGRLDNSFQMTTERKKGGKIVELAWKDCSDGHRNQASKRYMLKMFLKDLYVVWRQIEGLPVREPYAEEYLGKKHAA